MTDYAEEQRNELEAIESIYPDSFTGLTFINEHREVTELMLAHRLAEKTTMVS